MALTLLFFSQAHARLCPTVALDYISTGDAFRVAAHLALLYSLVTQLGGEIAGRTPCCSSI